MTLLDPGTLMNLIETADPGFENAFERLKHPQKGSMRTFLVYIDKVLNFMLHRQTEGLRTTQLHFPELTEDALKVLLEFVATRTFYRSLEMDEEQEDHVSKRIGTLQHKLNNTHAPADASAKNGGNTIFRRWMAEKASCKEELTLLNPIAPTRKSLLPDTILNIPIGDQEVLKDSLYATDIQQLVERHKRAYILLNTDLPIDQLISELMPLDILRRIRQFILFDCEGRRSSNSYNRMVLEKLIDRNYPVKDLVIFSFDKQPFRMRTLMNRLGLTYKRYFLPPQRSLDFKDTYVVQAEEIDRLVSNTPSDLSIRWIGDTSELFVDYLDLVTLYGAGKLKALSTLNTYAAAFNRTFADAQLADLFGEDTRQGLFDVQVRTAVSELDPAEQALLRTTINRLLNLVISEWETIKEKMRDYAGKGPVGAVIPFSLVENSFFRRGLREILPGIKVHIYTWKDIRDEDLKDEVIFLLAYRDTGRFPFDLYPSILEPGPQQRTRLIPLFLKMLFSDRYARCEYFYNKTKSQVLANECRYRLLDWRNIEQKIISMRLADQEQVLEEEEEDELADTIENIKVEYTDGSRATFYPSRPLIVCNEDAGRLAVLRADELPEDNAHLSIQPLDELYEGLNLFPITPDDEKELQHIKENYQVTEPDQVLWKVLLAKRMGEGRTKKDLYEEIEKVLRTKDFVQFEYFRDHWLNVSSALLIPRRRRHFRALCLHLELPSAYYRLKLKKRASLTANSRQSNARMGGLLGQMINEGLFEKDFDWVNSKLEHFMEEHELEEKGLTETNLNKELQALVHLLTDRLELKRVQKIERP